MYFRICLVSILALGAMPAADIRIVEEIICKVNGDIITKGEMERQRITLEAALRQEGLSGLRLQEGVRDREKDILRDQIDQLLLVSKAKDLNISVDADVTKRVAEIQTQSKIADPDKFHEWVREQAGMTFEDFKLQLKNQLLTQRVIGQEVQRTITIPEPEKRKYYEEHKSEFVREEEVYLRQILISTEGKTPEQAAAAEKKAKALVDRARKGEKFGDLARDNSDDTETAKNFGELPPFKRGQFRKEIEDIVFTQKKGYVTDPIRVPNGFIILRVEERFEKGQAPYDDVEEEITSRMAGPQMQPKLRAYLTRLRQDAFLQVREGYVDSGAAPGKDTSWQDVAQLKPETVTKEEVAARRRKKFLGIIPHGRVGPAATTATPSAGPGVTSPASTTPPAATPAPSPAATPAAPAAAPPATTPGSAAPAK
jgi:peptidyl-prolyl cis-trans isomerase SurA